MYDPSDILNLSKFNSGELDSYAEIPIDGLDIEAGVKRVSLGELEDPFRYLNVDY